MELSLRIFLLEVWVFLWSKNLSGVIRPVILYEFYVLLIQKQNNLEELEKINHIHIRKVLKMSLIGHGGRLYKFEISLEDLCIGIKQSESPQKEVTHSKMSIASTSIEIS